MKISSHRTEGAHRLYRLSQFKILKNQSSIRDRKTIAYARVSSSDQKSDLERRKKVLEMYCASHGWKFELLTDLGSGMKQPLWDVVAIYIDEDDYFTSVLTFLRSFL